VWDALPDSPGETPWRPASPIRERHPGSVDGTDPTQASAGRHRSNLASRLSCARCLWERRGRRLPGEAALRSTKCAHCCRLAPSLVGGTRASNRLWSAPRDRAAHLRPAPSGAGRLRAPSRQGSSPSGAKRRSCSSEANEPGPKGDARPSFPALTRAVIAPAQPGGCPPTAASASPPRAGSGPATPPNPIVPAPRLADCGSERYPARF